MPPAEDTTNGPSVLRLQIPQHDGLQKNPEKKCQRLARFKSKALNGSQPSWCCSVREENKAQRSCNQLAYQSGQSGGRAPTSSRHPSSRPSIHPSIHLSGGEQMTSSCLPAMTLDLMTAFLLTPRADWAKLSAIQSELLTQSDQSDHCVRREVQEKMARNH